VLDGLRARHRAYLRLLHDDGVVLASGPLEADVPRALIIVRAADASAAREIFEQPEFADGAPLTSVEVLEWRPTLGPFA
jgi:uncharacterized protein YciI